MAVVKTSCATFEEVGNALISSGFATNMVFATNSLTLGLSNYIYTGMKITRYNNIHSSLGMTYGSFDGTTYTSGLTLATSSISDSVDTFSRFSVYYDIAGGWFAVVSYDTATGVSFVYHGKLSNGANYSFVSSSVSYNGNASGYIINSNGSTNARCLGFFGTTRIGNYYATTDLLVTETASNNLIMNGSVPATVVGLKWVGAAASIETSYGDSIYAGYVSYGVHLSGSIFITFD